MPDVSISATALTVQRLARCEAKPTSITSAMDSSVVKFIMPNEKLNQHDVDGRDYEAEVRTVADEFFLFPVYRTHNK